MPIEENSISSRIARKPISVPTGVDVKLDTNEINVKGPKGNASLPLHPYVKVSFADGHINVALNKQTKKLVTGKNSKLYKSISGSIRANIANLIQGVTQGYEKKLVLVGIGYRAQSKGNALTLSLGFSQPVDFKIPTGMTGITFETPTQTEIIVKGIDKTLVGLIAAKIRRLRPPEPYKGKGVRYSDEHVVIKETKKK